MSNLAQRIRDIRYKKGLGPDALAARAEISRTALYQIECGKTEVPRAGTLRRIARALEVPVDDLLGYWPREESVDQLQHEVSPAHRESENISASDRDWSYPDDPELTSYRDAHQTFEVSVGHSELMHKLEDLLDSRFADSITRIIEDTHAIMIAGRSQSTGRVGIGSRTKTH
jgi:transcriptional regulator with XRE-family HTH domain